MQFFLAKSFTRALSNLDKSSESLAKQAALEFQLDPQKSSFKFHRIENARDRNMWSFRVNRDLRAIVHHRGEVFVLCYVDHHDAAYDWAERHRIEQHPTTHQIQLVEVVERTEVVTHTVHEQERVALPPLADFPVDLLLRCGVPVEWIDWVRMANQDALLEQMERLPEEAQEHLLALLTGGLSAATIPPLPPRPVAAPQPVTLPVIDEASEPTSPTEPEEEEAPLVVATAPAPLPSREIVAIASPDELSRALDAPWEEWLAFLHPEQREIAYATTSGAARVYGSAGTGKTIVALHRVKHLVETYPEAPILFTTYTKALTSNLQKRLNYLLSEEAGEQDTVTVSHLHKWLSKWYRDHTQRSLSITLDAELKTMLQEQLDADEQLLEAGFDFAYLLSEWRAIIEPFDIRTRDEYFRIARTGRGRPLGKRQKLALWNVFEQVISQLDRSGRPTFKGLAGVCARYYEGRPVEERPFAHIVVDEAQDFSPVELRCLRSLVPPGKDDLFLCSDSGQRLYGRIFSWLRSGIDVRGRSYPLRINYRTTEQIRGACEALLPTLIDGPEGEHEGREARSLRRGEELQLFACADHAEQTEHLSRWVERQIEVHRIEPHQIAIFARVKNDVFRAARGALQPLGLSYYEITASAKSNQNDEEELEGKVAVGSMQSAKGLEFKAVAIVDCNHDKLPLQRTLDELKRSDESDLIDQLEMERNLLYVAGTRARDYLFLSYVGAPSPFLDTLLESRRTLPATQEAVNSPPSPEVTAQPDVISNNDDVQPPFTGPPRVEAPYVKAARLPTSFKISPSRIAQYFGYDCQRFLRFGSAWSEAQHVIDATPSEDEPTSYSRAILESGYSWELHVLEHLIPADNLRVAPGSSPVTERYFNATQTLEVLREARPGDFIYEATLRPPESFYTHYRIDTSRITMSDNRPDLIQVLAHPHDPQKRLLRIIDLKRGQHLRSTYRIQLILYALQLRDIVLENGISDLEVDLSKGAVWLGYHDAPTECDIDAVRPHVEQFLREDVQEIFGLPAEQVRWHLHYKCEWCPFWSHCHAEMERTDDLSRLPRLTHQGKRFLEDHGIDTIAALDDLLVHHKKRADGLLTASASLATQRHALDARVHALHTDSVIVQGAMAHGLTRQTPHEVQIFITLQREALGQHTYAMGYHIRCGEQVPERVLLRRPEEQNVVMVANSPEELASIRRQFVVELHNVMTRIDAYNLGQEWRAQLSLQFFVYSSSEEALLTELLFEAMQERETRRAAQTLLLYFQGPDLILTQEHPADHVSLPVAILLNIIGQVLALPISVAYTLPETLAALQVPIDYPRDDTFHYPLTPQLRGDSIYRAWYQGERGEMRRFEAHLHQYLRALSALYDVLRQVASDELHTFMPKFSLPLPTRIHTPLLSQLAFFTQYESVLRCKEVRATRQIARHAISYSDRIHELRATEEPSLFEIMSQDVTRLEPDPYQTWLLVRDTPEGRGAQIRYNDYIHRESHTGGTHQSPHVAILRLKELVRDASGQATHVRVYYTRKFSENLTVPGDRLLLYERFTDGLVDRTLAALERIEQRERSLFVELMTAPESPRFHDDAPLPDAVTASLDTLAAQSALTTSQRDAFTHLTRNRVLALWGPPGTGKTHFLATTILCLLEAHRQAGLPFSVMVTGFTHASIENLMRKLVSIQEKEEIYQQDAPRFAKMSSWKGEGKPDALKVISPKKALLPWLETHAQGHLVIAGTTWAFDTHMDDVRFDLVVVDEASQVKVPEAAIAMSMVKEEQGRVIFAGDHLQLPPIVAGVYPEPAEGEVMLHRSIFEAACQLAQGRYMKQLQENFRMNRTLTRLSASLLYGPGYCCGNEAVATRRLPLAPLPKETPELLQTCLDQESSMVIVLVDGEIAAKESATEATLTAKLVHALRAHLFDTQSTSPYASDRAFFSHGVFVVSPHHAQLKKIRHTIDELAPRPLDAPAFVDTVDKMQGQEAEVVIVSYGVSDPEYAAMEASFIYGLNRLNVSITRGRSKTILLLSRNLLDAPPRVLENEEAAQGLSYMRRLVEEVRERGQTPTMFIEQGATLEVLAI